MLEKFLNGEIRVLLKTREEAEKFLKMLEQNTSVRWAAGELPTQFIPPTTPFALECSNYFGHSISYSAHIEGGDVPFSIGNEIYVI